MEKRAVPRRKDAWPSKLAQYGLEMGALEAGFERYLSRYDVAREG